MKRIKVRELPKFIHLFYFKMQLKPALLLIFISVVILGTDTAPNPSHDIQDDDWFTEAESEELEKLLEEAKNNSEQHSEMIMSRGNGHNNRGEELTKPQTKVSLNCKRWGLC